MRDLLNNVHHSLEKLKPSIEGKYMYSLGYMYYCKLSLKSKSAELLSTTERHKLDRAALDKQLMSQERELIHCKAQLTKEKQVLLLLV